MNNQNDIDKINEEEVKKGLDDLLIEINENDKEILHTLTSAGKLNKEIDKTIEDFENTEKELKQFEEDIVNEIDDSVIEYIS